jgi:hypothetical protein
MIGLQVAKLSIKGKYIIGLRRIAIMVLAGKFNQFPKKIGPILLKTNLIIS